MVTTERSDVAQIGEMLPKANTKIAIIDNVRIFVTELYLP